MASVKSKILLIYCFLVSVSMTIGQNVDTLPVYKTKYQHIVFKIDDKYLNYTDIVSIFRNYNVLAKGFLSMGNDLVRGVYFIDGKNYKHQYYEISKVDTIDNIKWQRAEEIQPLCDSSCFEKKIEYSFVLHKFKEKKLSEDNIKKIRLVFPESTYSAQNEWRLLKILFYQDSTILIRKISDVVDSTGRKITASKTIKLNDKEKKSFLSDLDKIAKQQERLVCTTTIYPWLLEYYDGNSEYCYFYSDDCKNARKIKKQCDKIIGKILFESRNHN